MERIEIQPASIEQVRRGRAGKSVLVSDDVGGVAKDLAQIDPTLKLVAYVDEDIYAVEQHVQLSSGQVEEHLVTTSTTCDQRLVERIREITRPGYDVAAEQERIETEAQARHTAEQRERVGDAAERLAFALSRDLGRHEIANTKSSRIVLPRELPGG